MFYNKNMKYDQDHFKYFGVNTIEDWNKWFEINEKEGILNW